MIGAIFLVVLYAFSSHAMSRYEKLKGAEARFAQLVADRARPESDTNTVRLTPGFGAALMLLPEDAVAKKLQLWGTKEDYTIVCIYVVYTDGTQKALVTQYLHEQEDLEICYVDHLAKILDLMTNNLDHGDQIRKLRLFVQYANNEQLILDTKTGKITNIPNRHTEQVNGIIQLVADYILHISTIDFAVVHMPFYAKPGKSIKYPDFSILLMPKCASVLLPKWHEPLTLELLNL